MLTAFSRFLTRLTTMVITSMFGVLVLLIFTQVVLRYVFSSSLLWVEELGRFMFMWLIWLGVTIGIMKKSHIGVDFFVNLLPAKCQRWVTVLSTVITGTFFLILSYWGFNFAMKNIVAQSTVLLIPMGYVYMILPVCSFICVVYCLQQIMEALSNQPRDVVSNQLQKEV